MGLKVARVEFVVTVALTTVCVRIENESKMLFQIRKKSKTIILN